MGKGFILRWLLMAGVSAGSVLTAPTIASASATITDFTFSQTEVFNDAPPECMPVIKAGVTTATDSGSGQVTATANGYAVHMTEVFSYRTDFPDGSYLTGVGVSHNSWSGSDSRFVFTSAGTEPRTIYAADGTVTGTAILHGERHITVNTVTGVVSADIDKFFFVCTGR